MEKYLSNNITDRQKKVLEHYVKTGGFDVENVEYIKNEEYLDDPSSVDIAIFAPTENFDYYTVATVGLSSFQPDPSLACAEIFMLLPSSWKFDLEKSEYSWPIDLLQDVAQNYVENKKGIGLYQVVQMADEAYSEGTDIVGGILCFPELNIIDFVEEKIENSYTRFFNFVPLDKNQLNKILDVGVQAFVEFDLHDIDGPVNFVAKEPQTKKGTNIDRIIEHNVSSLNKKD